jgi:hypothetical protein
MKYGHEEIGVVLWDKLHTWCARMLFDTILDYNPNN